MVGEAGEILPFHSRGGEDTGVHAEVQGIREKEGEG